MSVGNLGKRVREATYPWEVQYAHKLSSLGSWVEIGISKELMSEKSGFMAWVLQSMACLPRSTIFG